MNEQKRLYRVERDAKLAGVCGGIGEYVNLDANLIRLIWVVISLCSLGAGLLLYLAAAVLLPKKSDIYPGF